MDLNTAFFLFFFFPVSVVFYLIVPGTRWKNLLLAAVSLIFYAFGQWQGIVILLLSVLVNYAAGALFLRGRWKKPALAAVLALNVALLLWFKYLNLLIGTVNSLLSLSVPALSMMAPVGISFFTFKAMSYDIDVYRGGETGGFLDVLLYISFFPQVTSGPITRFGQFSARLRERSMDPEQMARGLRRFTIGLSKKLLIAGLVAEIADSAFALGSGAGAAALRAGMDRDNSKLTVPMNRFRYLNQSSSATLSASTIASTGFFHRPRRSSAPAAQLIRQDSSKMMIPCH